jgi:hypothetical protein
MDTDEYQLLYSQHQIQQSNLTFNQIKLHQRFDKASTEQPFCRPIIAGLVDQPP